MCPSGPQFENVTRSQDMPFAGNAGTSLRWREHSAQASSMSAVTGTPGQQSAELEVTLNRRRR